MIYPSLYRVSVILSIHEHYLLTYVIHIIIWYCMHVLLCLINNIDDVWVGVSRGCMEPLTLNLFNSIKTRKKYKIKIIFKQQIDYCWLLIYHGHVTGYLRRTWWKKITYIFYDNKQGLVALLNLPVNCILTYF